MIINAEGLGKKYAREWIFKNFSCEFKSGHKYAITGRNGSGKSTLLKVLASAIQASEGNLNYFDSQGKEIAPEAIFRQLTYMAPYMEVIEEFTLQEFLTFYINFKSINLSIAELIEKLRFTTAKNKLIRNFSSGMKQRLQLGLALFSDAEIVFLDEPTSNLDKPTTAWYLETVLQTIQNRILIISSNQESEYSFCDEIISIDCYKY